MKCDRNKLYDGRYNDSDGDAYGNEGDCHLSRKSHSAQAERGAGVDRVELEVWVSFPWYFTRLSL